MYKREEKGNKLRLEKLLFDSFRRIEGPPVSYTHLDKKLENPILGKKVLKISGMHCEHCVKAVTEAINKIDGAAAKVNLSENEAVVSYDRELDDEQLRKIVKDAGYRVVSIK